MLPATLRDASFAWKVEVRNISSTGALLQVFNKHNIGKGMELEVRPERRAALRIRGEIVHVQPGGFVGFKFDVTRSEDYEKTVDLFEWLMAQEPSLAVEVQKRPVTLAKSATLYAMTDTDVQPRPEEARFMTLFVGGRTLADVQKILGARFDNLMYLTFALLDRRLLTMIEPGKYKGR